MILLASLINSLAINKIMLIKKILLAYLDIFYKKS